MAKGLRKPCVLLISPGIIKWTDMDFGLPHLVSMGGYLQREVDVRVELLDLNYEGGDQAQLGRTLDDLGPFLVIGVSCFSSFDYMRVLTLGRFLKDRYPDVPLVTGGYHASALPGDVVFDGSPFDAVVVGEGEVPMLEIVQSLMGSGRLEKRLYGPSNIQNLDDLPPYKWELLKRYWPRAKTIGRKFQIYLSRGCPYHCTFCMERAKTEYKWRAYSSERAVNELERLSRFTDLGHWVVNLADPLFGFKRSWRREVLQGIISKGLIPRQYWTLTRSDDLDETDVRLLAKARFSIGIGLESGSPDMLVRMQKGNTPEKYLAAMMRVARLSRDHGLNWASNIIVGHPGETRQSMIETRDYLFELFTSAKETCGWLSIDPFRLYPGAYVHEAMGGYQKQYGTRFYHPEWWKSWYDGPFRAEHIDPSAELDFNGRVEFMYDAYAPLVAQIAKRFRGQDRSVDRVFKRSLQEQVRSLGPEGKAAVLARAARAKKDLERAKRRPETSASAKNLVLSFPIGLHVKDAWIRRREEAVRRLLERGILRTERLIEAFLQVAPEKHLDDDVAMAVLGGQRGNKLGELGINVVAMALEALEPAGGDRVLELTSVNGYVSELLAQLVTSDGELVCMWDGSKWGARQHKKALLDYPWVRVVMGDRTVAPREMFDRIYFGGAMPRFPKAVRRALAEPDGRAVGFLGPRFRPQDLVSLVRQGEEIEERIVARILAPVMHGKNGWIISGAA